MAACHCPLQNFTNSVVGNPVFVLTHVTPALQVQVAAGAGVRGAYSIQYGSRDYNAFACSLQTAHKRV